MRQKECRIPQQAGGCREIDSPLKKQDSDIGSLPPPASLPVTTARVRHSAEQFAAGHHKRYQYDQDTDHQQTPHSIQVHHKPGIQQADDTGQAAVDRIRNVMSQIAEGRSYISLCDAPHRGDQDADPHIIEK